MQFIRSSTHPAGTSQQQQQQQPSKADETESQRASIKPFSPVLEDYFNKRFEWKIQGCSKLVSPDKGDKAEKTYYLRSPTFRFMDRTWYLHFYPNLPNMVVCLMPSGEASGPPSRLYQYFGLKNAKGETEWRFEAIGNFGSGTQNMWKKKGQRFLDIEELTERGSDLVKDDSIIIVCNLSTDECMRFMRDFTCSLEEYESRELEREVEGHTLLRIKGLPFYVDLDCIRLHSPLLASHLVTGEINEGDGNPFMIATLLRYLEWGVVFAMSMDEVIHFYKLAVTYQIVGLRERCLALMTACLGPKEVLKVIDFAKKHSEPELLQIAIKYLVSHAQLVLATKEWMQLVKNDPERANQFYRRIAGRFTAAVCP